MGGLLKQSRKYYQKINRTYISVLRIIRNSCICVITEYIILAFELMHMFFCYFGKQVIYGSSRTGSVLFITPLEDLGGGFVLLDVLYRH